jgi:hypothetical protein
MARFITLAGKKQVGKDTSAGLIYNLIYPTIQRTDQFLNGHRIHPKEAYQIHVVHFADALKKACSLIFGISMQDMESEEGKLKPTTVVWPNFGTYIPQHESFRQPDGTMPMRKVYFPTRDTTNYMTVREILQFVGTDLLRNQLDPDIWVRSVFNQPYGQDDIVIIADCRFPNEAVFAKENGLLIKIERGTAQKDTHISETALDSYSSYDEIVDNNGNIDKLRADLEKILRKHRFIS